jgi:DNA-binding transcriptional MocR family regulator
MTDDAERQVAAEIGQSHPQWLVLWGYHSRLFWAFPYFQVPQGTIVSARDRDKLLAGMQSIEVWASGRQPMTALSPVAAGEPRG